MIGHIGEIAGPRDRDALEFTMASGMFEATKARLLSLWRIAPRVGGSGAPSRVTHGSTRREPCEATSRTPPRDPAEPFAGIGRASQRRLRARSRVRNFYRHACHGVVRLAEIARAMAMGVDAERPAVGLSRIFGGHLGGLNRQGVRDILAGLPDRRAFGARFRELISPKLGRDTSPFGPLRVGDETRGAQLAMIERDSVKRVNDGFGHPGGDEALAMLARLLGESFRETDRLFHFGGETFVAVLPDTDSQGAAAALERLRALVENFDFSRVGRVTVSIGYTAARRDDTGASASARAQEALYAAKEQGRNRLCCFETLPARGAVAAG